MRLVCDRAHTFLQPWQHPYPTGVALRVSVVSIKSPQQNQAFSVRGLAFISLSFCSSVCVCVCVLWVFTLFSPCVFHYGHSYYFQKIHSHIPTFPHPTVQTHTQSYQSHLVFMCVVLSLPLLSLPSPFSVSQLYSRSCRHQTTFSVTVCKNRHVKLHSFIVYTHIP